MSKNKEIKTKGKASSEDAMIGANLNKIRKLNNVSQTELASFLDMTFQQVQKYESGSNRISAFNLMKIAQFFNVDIRVFYDGLFDLFEEPIIPLLSPNALRVAKALDEIKDPKRSKEIISVIKNIIKMMD